MDKAQRYLRAKAIAAAADELSEAERDAYVTRECGDDAALRAEVAWLQEALSEQTTGSGRPRQDAPDLSGAELAAAVGSDYRLLRQVGRGGMGVVYLAERHFGDGVQTVALKLLDTGDWPADDAARRFAREAAILARLSHPNIAGLLDAGCLAGGRPFLAMEYVAGERIDRWCAAHAPALESRLRLFLKVCAAVAHAHRQLVIHRDLKPGNILVDAGGEPKLLDFGIARLLEGGVATRTATAQRAMTLAYASPEQIRNEPLGTSSDVWQLGVVLYELVSGARPFPASDSPLTLSHAILTGEPPPPSRAASTDAFPTRGRLPADIDAIVLKAMRAAPGERYPGVAELAADLQRFLESRPVQARRGQWRYRAGRFVRRQRGAVAAGVLIAALLVGFGFAREAQLHRTEVERDKAQALAGFMRELFEDADPSRTGGNRISVAEALDQGVARLRQRRDIEPAVRAALLLSIGRGYTALDLGDRAIPPLREAEALLRRVGADPLARGRTLAALGRAYSMVLDTPSSIVADRKAIALLEHASGEHTDEILRVRINLLFGHMTVADLPPAETIRQLDAAVVELEARATPDRELLAQALAARSMTRLGEGDDVGAAADADRALVLVRGLYPGDQDPAPIYYRFTVALARIRRDPPQAVREFRVLAAEYETMNGTPTPNMGAVLAYLGWALVAAGQHADAVPVLRRAEAVARGYADVAPDFHLRTLTWLAEQLHATGHDNEAAALMEPAMPTFATRSARGAAWAVNAHVGALNVLGAVALARGARKAAQARYREALAVAETHAAVVGAAQREASRNGLCMAREAKVGCTP